ncbi:polyglutamylase complex subunit TTLL1 isoform X3 [Dermacentor albipictus]|uniref:polyglutamylase complex subunit TTLL1 isoform X3 n=1 Tax=Dermacentor albipictus TaxID=60249 RepID=UPI0038FD0C25
MMLVLLQPCPLKQEGSGWEFIGMIVDVMGLGLIVSGRFSVPAMPGLRARVVAVRSRESSGREIGQFVQLPTESPRDLDDGGECTRAVTSGEMTAAHSKWQQARKAICVRNRQRDLLARHMQRYQRQRSKALQRDEPPPPAIVPSTYVLPRDYSMFVDEYKKLAGGGSSLWIVKPCGKAQGIGIKLVDRPSQVKSLINRYRKGFCRFCQLHYRTKGLDNPFVHLTNVSVQRHGGRYNQSHGGKWSLSSLETFVRGTRGSASAARLRQDLRQLVAHSLTAVAPSMLSDWHCFECYGYDVLLDEDLRPWLLEVNASPSLTSSTRADALLKQALVDDVLRLVAPSGKPSASAYSEADLGDFERILPAAQTPP